MANNQAQQLLFHPSSEVGRRSAVQQATAFHVQLIEQRLAHTGLTPQQQCAVVDGILSALRTNKREPADI